MVTKVCISCGQVFTPRPQVPAQGYCAAPPCQRDRRQRWQREKLISDPDYRDNQSRSQRAWLDRNPNYWREYRRAKRGEQAAPEERTSKGGTEKSPALGGVYRIRLIVPSSTAKSDAWLAEITPICGACPCKGNACKETT
jgi:hypothetical protein